ncbi:MAG: peroxiredoxin-like family protein [Flavobacteriaceae bacterium]|nr:peroxiredoxin-like family protein [Flavobacteriaceae bacterium]
MNFQERLAQKKKQVESNLTPGQLKILHRLIKGLKKTKIEEKVLKKGSLVPSFSLMNQEGVLKNSTDILLEKPLVLTFYRGFWCSYCNLDLANLNRYVVAIQASGADLVAISPEKPEFSKKIIAMQKLNFDILWDQGNKLASEFGLKFFLPEDAKKLYSDSFHINLKHYHGDDEWALPIPARFVIDRSGIIRYAESNADYTKRPDPDDALAVLKSL